MKILVTGIAGFLGSHLADHLLQLGHDVVGLDNMSGGFEQNVPDRAILIKRDICDAQLVDSIFQLYSFDVVYHVAAYAAEGLSHFIKRFNYANNLQGSANLLTAAVNYDVKLFVYTSSIAVYGNASCPMHETMETKPEDPYGIAKLAFEMELRVTQQMFGLPYVIFRPHNVYGEKQNIADPYRNVVGIFIRQALTGEPFTIFGDGKQTRAFSHINDVIPIIAQAGTVKKAWNDIFNVGTDKAYTVNEIAQIVAKAVGVKPKFSYFPERAEAHHAWCDHSKVHYVFGQTSGISLEEGIIRMVKWVKKQGVPKATAVPTVEIARNLPAAWRKYS